MSLNYKSECFENKSRNPQVRIFLFLALLRVRAGLWMGLRLCSPEFEGQLGFVWWWVLLRLWELAGREGLGDPKREKGSENPRTCFLASLFQGFEMVLKKGSWEKLSRKGMWTFWRIWGKLHNKECSTLSVRKCVKCFISLSFST